MDTNHSESLADKGQLQIEICEYWNKSQRERQQTRMYESHEWDNWKIQDLISEWHLRLDPKNNMDHPLLRGNRTINDEMTKNGQPLSRINEALAALHSEKNTPKIRAGKLTDPRDI